VELARKGGERTTVTVTLAELDTSPQVAQVDAPEEETTENPSAVMGLLGITVEELAQRDVDQLNLTEDDQGLVVVDVRPGGPSWERLGRAEIITTVEGTRVRTQADLRAALDEAGTGSIVSLDVVRATTDGTARRIVRIRLGD
jgi:S1-C subfamily serine protease